MEAEANAQVRDPIPVEREKRSWEEEVLRWDVERRVVGDVENLLKEAKRKIGG